MEPNNSHVFLRVKDRVINKNFIRWVEEQKPCYKLCTIITGCKEDQTNTVCKGELGFEAIDKLYTSAKQ